MMLSLLFVLCGCSKSLYECDCLQSIPSKSATNALGAESSISVLQRQSSTLARLLEQPSERIQADSAEDSIIGPVHDDGLDATGELSNIVSPARLFDNFLDHNNDNQDQQGINNTTNRQTTTLQPSKTQTTNLPKTVKTMVHNTPLLPSTNQLPVTAVGVFDNERDKKIFKDFLANNQMTQEQIEFLNYNQFAKHLLKESWAMSKRFAPYHLKEVDTTIINKNINMILNGMIPGITVLQNFTENAENDSYINMLLPVKYKILHLLSKMGQGDIAKQAAKVQIAFEYATLVLLTTDNSDYHSKAKLLLTNTLNNLEASLLDAAPVFVVELERHGNQITQSTLYKLEQYAKLINKLSSHDVFIYGYLIGGEFSRVEREAYGAQLAQSIKQLIKSRVASNFNVTSGYSSNEALLSMLQNPNIKDIRQYVTIHIR